MIFKGNFSIIFENITTMRENKLDNMAYVYAALLLNETGNKPTAETITSVLKAAGATDEEVNQGFAQAIESSLEGLDINEIKEEAMAFKPAAAPSTSPEAEESKGKEEAAREKEAKEEKEKKGEAPEEEGDVEGLSDLF